MDREVVFWRERNTRRLTTPQVLIVELNDVFHLHWARHHISSLELSHKISDGLSSIHKLTSELGTPAMFVERVYGELEHRVYLARFQAHVAAGVKLAILSAVLCCEFPDQRFDQAD